MGERIRGGGKTCILRQRAVRQASLSWAVAYHRLCRAGSEQGLGISAVSLGIAPDRSGDPPTGSDIALDALAEEEVAHSVRSLIEQHSGPQGRQ